MPYATILLSYLVPFFLIFILGAGVLLELTAEADSLSLPEQITQAAADDGDIKSYDFYVRETPTSIILTGSVSSQSERTELIDIANARANGKSVIDNLQVAEEAFKDALPPKHIVLSETQQILAQSNVRDGSTTYSNGTLLVSGDFESFRDVDRLLAELLNVDGVQSVNTNVTVNGKPYLESALRNGRASLK